MKINDLTITETRALVSLALLGLVIPNGIFFYFLLMKTEVVKQALTNPVAMIFIVEAFVLMLLFAWLLAKAGVKRPNGLSFLLLSMLGTLTFSVPTALYFIFRDKRITETFSHGRR